MSYRNGSECGPRILPKALVLATSSAECLCYHCDCGPHVGGDLDSMAINRDKVLREAEKLVQKGRIELAIREYEKLLKVNPSDANTINRVGDLYGRVGQVDKFIEIVLGLCL